MIKFSITPITYLPILSTQKLLKMSGDIQAKIVVVGSCMIDFSFYAPQLPKPGETLHGTKFIQGYGGKGANQCVAASKLGASTALIARLGEDSFGRDYLKALTSNNINTSNVRLTAGVSSGIAEITIAENGENNIVIIAGANNQLSKSDIDSSAVLIKSADVCVYQFETPVPTTIHALRTQTTGISIVNGAPAIADPDPDIFRLATIFCVNETEAGAMTGMVIESVADAEIAMKKFFDKGCNTVIITLGKEGAVFATKEDKTTTHIPSKVVTPVDSTGAGDMFIGALAYYLAYFPKLQMKECIRRSCEIAAISVQSLGTQTSFPVREQLPEMFFAST